MVHTLLRSSPWFYALVAASMGAAGCFSSPINRAPVVTGLGADVTPLHGQPATITAQGYDPDDDQLTWTWAMTPLLSPNVCPDKSDPANWPPQTPTPSNTSSPTSYLVTGTLTSSSWCVWAFATDRYGAVGVDNTPLVPSNNPPQPVLRVVSPNQSNSYPAYTHFELAADLSSDADGDTLVYKLTLDQAPLGSTASLLGCDDATIKADPRFQCLDVLLPGQYVISLAVYDGTTTNTTSLTLNVLTDQPPCIAMTMPMYGTALLKDDPTAPSPITVNLVSDDGDPYPNTPRPFQTVKFTWFKGKNDGALQYADNGSFSMLNLVATDYQPGDVANVRLEVHDRNTAAIDAILLGCGEQPFCPVAPGSTCFVRVSWRIEMDL